MVNIRQDQELLAAVDAALDDVRSLNGYRQACQTQRPNTVALRNKYTGEVKLSREDILAHAYAQCRSNKGAPGVDGEDFADIEAYGVERWLGELALALRQETYRPNPIRRVYIPKANGKLRPLGISMRPA